MRTFSFGVLAAVAGTVLGHGDHGTHGQKPAVGEDASWMTKHMAGKHFSSSSHAIAPSPLPVLDTDSLRRSLEEHHAADFDAASFFSLHDFNGDSRWEPEEILRTYGLFDESNAHVASTRRDEIVKQILDLLDTSGDGVVSRDEFVHFIEIEGRTLPDVGMGPGHHGDDEYEYEIHHWEK